MMTPIRLARTACALSNASRSNLTRKFLVSSVQQFQRTPAPTVRTFSTAERPLEPLRTKNARDLARLTEMIQTEKFYEFLKSNDFPLRANALDEITAAGLTKEDMLVCLKAAFLTYLVHVESRVASACGHGFYTIGPCGEELMGVVGKHLRATDSMALHYRHVSTQLARQLLSGKPISEILLDRARGHAVSASDPVTGGAHCAIGGGEYDFLVTSTLASQSCPAVGRALGSSLATYIKSMNPGMEPLFPKDMVSFVSLGDGSANNAHFLSGVNIAEYAKHRKFKCPVVFCITDNDVSISLRGYDYVKQSLIKKFQMPVYIADGKDILSISKATKDAIEYSRSRSEPTLVYVNNITRRFGHAATDRQPAYLTEQEISDWANTNPLESLCKLVSEAGIMSMAEQQALFAELHQETRTAFDIASGEQKIVTRENLLDRVSMPLVTPPAAFTPATSTETTTIYGLGASPHAPTSTNHIQDRVSNQLSTPNLSKITTPVPTTKDVMRKHMTRVYDEILGSYPQAVYIGEDVIHGGYYLVTEGLAQKYPHRVRDFPPDETSLLGIGMGFSQQGLVSIVEIPYAKYLDCGFDMFAEAAFTSWLSNRKQPNGMFIRLQGIGRGVFGGSMHCTTSMWLPTGIDVVCYSNGRDYAMGTRYAMYQASKGRVVMSVDFTHLLNLRHVHNNDDALRQTFTDVNEYLDFDTVRVYHGGNKANARKNIVLVSYGEAMVTSLQAQKQIMDTHPDVNVDVIDCMLLNRVPTGLVTALQEGNYDGSIFVDSCKKSQAPLASHIGELQNEDVLPQKWKLVAAPNTYGSLGNTLAFVSIEDVLTAANKIIPTNTVQYSTLH